MKLTTTTSSASSTTTVGLSKLTRTTTILGLLFLACLFVYCDCCSCQLAHPQAHYCTADYVILARVKNIERDDVNVNYTIRVNKVFKKSENSVLGIQQKRIFSPAHEMACGVKLEKRKSYLIAGRAIDGRLRLVMCDYHQDWKKLTLKQKKGFKVLYDKGCNCRVLPCPWWSRKNCMNTTANKCPWETLHEGDFDCQGLSSVCMRQTSGSCGWNHSQKYRHCMKLRKEHKERMRAIEP